MTTYLFLDTETYCETPISYGTNRYAADSEIMIITYALDEGPVEVIDLTASEDRMLSWRHELVQAMRDPAVIKVIHNSYFDRNVIKFSGEDIPVEQIHDTMVMAMAHGLPGGLDKLCDIFGVGEELAKNKTGKQLINLFCKPRPKNLKTRRATRETHPQEWQDFIDYAKSDISAMRAVYKLLPKWNYKGEELALWHLDQKINDRGVAVDLTLAHAAIRSADLAQTLLAERTVELTEGEVTATTQRDALLAHILETYDVLLPDMKGSTLERVLKESPHLPDVVVELINNRMQASATSSTKYKTLINGTSADGRLRGTLQFCGATRTGRWAGRMFQPQNLMRVPKYLQKQYDFAIETIKANAVDLFFDNPMEVLGACVRGAIIAPPGKKLVIADLSNIEGRMLAWLAGEEWKLQAFRDFDAGKGADLYKLAYAKAFGVPVEHVDNGDQRHLGKLMELALGYEGGVGAFLTFAAAYGIDLEAMADKAFDNIPADIIAEAMRAYQWAEKEHRTFGLSERAWLTCDAFKRLWRRAHPETASFWRDLENVVKQAITYGGTQFECRKLKVMKTGDWLRICLPSGRQLVYPQAALDNGKITYMGVNQYTRKWQRLHTYGGKLAENVTQAAARDVIGHGMPLVEAAGYEIVITVHDEDITETPDLPKFNAKHLATLMTTIPSWGSGLPLAAAGFETYRYRKE
jgi:DNA polymerase